ncbi:MAG: hypothetical protein ACPLXC_01595 [Candidatus Pacearchaeota archaeon]
MGFIYKVISYLPRINANFYFTSPLLDTDMQVRWLHKKGLNVEEIVKDLCYDRDFCESYGIDYCNITSKDILKIKKYVNEVLNA